MDDRIAEIREALDWYDGVFASLDELAVSAPRRLKHIAAAAREWVDLLDSDALIIRRDENGEWPKFPDAEPILEALGYDGDWDSAPRASVAIIDVLDALVSSQGVEP